MTTAAQGSDNLPDKLVITDGLGSTRTVFLNRDTYSIGRELNNDIALDDLGVSRYHARITRRQGQFVIEDLHSANGTLVGGVRLTALGIVRYG